MRGLASAEIVSLAEEFPCLCDLLFLTLVQTEFAYFASVLLDLAWHRRLTSKPNDFFTGMRKSEVLNSRWEQVDFLRGTIRLYVVETKNGSGPDDPRRLAASRAARRCHLGA